MTVSICGCVFFSSGQLSPPAYAPLLSYITGWFNFLGNVCVHAGALGCVCVMQWCVCVCLQAAGDASFAYGFADAVDGAVQVNVAPLQPYRLLLSVWGERYS